MASVYVSSGPPSAYGLIAFNSSIGQIQKPLQQRLEKLLDVDASTEAEDEPSRPGIQLSIHDKWPARSLVKLLVLLESGEEPRSSSTSGNYYQDIKRRPYACSVARAREIQGDSRMVCLRSTGRGSDRTRCTVSRESILVLHRCLEK
jgi:hypothetical protein